MKNFWKFGSWLLVVLVVFLGGCGPNYKMVKELHLSQGSDIRPHATAAQGQQGTPTINFNYMALDVDAEWASSSSAEQRAVNDLAAALGLNGSTPSLATKGGALSLDQVKSIFEQAVQARRDAEAVPVPKKEVVRPVEEPEDQKSVTEHGIYWGLTNGDRPTWYFSKDMTEYPAAFDIIIPGCKTISVTGNNGVRFDAGGGNLVKQSETDPRLNRGMAVLAAKGCTSTVARL